MVCRGSVKNGVVVLEGDVQLPEGTVVRIETLEEAASAPRQSGRPAPLFQMGRHSASTGIPDLATNIDHYLYGHPRVRNE